MTKSQIAREYRTKYPSYPSKKLGRIIYRDHNLLFKDEENARSILRMIEGKTGSNTRSATNKAFEVAEARPYNPYKLPGSDAVKKEPHRIAGYKRALIIADVHLPYHDINAITTAFNYAKKQKPDLVVLNGDIIDCFKLSKFSKDPSKRNFAYELAQLKKFIEGIHKTFKCKVVYKMGNHEIRYEHFLYEKAGELVGVEEFELTNILQARAEGVDIVKDKTVIKLNDLNLLHGHEFGRGFFNPVNVARGLQLRAKVSAMQADAHKTSEHTETDLEGKIKTTWSIGALCGLSPDYAPFNSWNHGFAIVDMDANGVDFDVINKRIYRGKVL